jgi:EmrB/QacA subfamily drug resistance transporter
MLPRSRWLILEEGIIALKDKSYYKWIIFFTVSIGTYMAALDSSIVNISMPTITKHFHSDVSTTNWIISTYLLTLSGMILIFGKLSDMISRKVFFTIGLAIFTFSSLTCGLSGSLAALITSRFMQAIGGAMIMSNSPAIITEAFPYRERGKALGAIGTVVALGIMTGAPLGGKIVSILSWPYIFFINIPIGIAGVILSITLLKDKADSVTLYEPFDFLGASLLIVFMITFLLGLNIGAKGSFNLRIVHVLFAVSVISFAAFLIVETKVKNPTMELNLFKNAGFSSTNISSLLAYMTIFMIIFMLPFFLERVKGLKPDVIGAILMTPTFMLFIFSPVFGWVSDKIGHRFLRCLGLSIMALAFFLLSHITETTSIYNIIFILLIYGFGIGMFMPPNNSLLMGSVPKNKLGTAASMLATTRNMGMMMGVASASAIFTYRVKFYSVEKMMEAVIVKKLSLPYSDVFFTASLLCLLGVAIAFMQGKITNKEEEHG